ncbi:TVP38/TMEM64 family protein [Natronorubrum halophilum]|uniref:TVP38/TMEM64 family protein n=1 Tax=Natronorubrum halophilum TaxID=1702106 RepID=UPI0010C22142|nr:VTT domain-containing protein [Natronorubrum halophilum]
MSPSSVGTRALVSVVAIGTIVTAVVLGSPTTALETVESVSADPALFGLVVIGLYLLRPLLALPTTPLAVVVGYGYGVTLGIPIALVGVLVTVTPVFLVARWVTRDASSADSGLESIGGPFGTALERTGTAVSRYYERAGSTRGVVASRLAPLPSDVSTCAAAVSGVSLRQFLFGTAVGELPWTVAAVVVGSSAATVTTGGFGELGLTLTLVCGVAAATLLAGPAYRAVRSRTEARNAVRSTDS